MTLKTFKACFKVLFKLNDDLVTDSELTIENKEKTLLFSNEFPSDH